MNKDALIIFAHGSREPAWAKPFERIRALIQRDRPNVVVELAYLELMQPTLLTVIDRLHGQKVAHITVAPAFLAPGGHVSRNLPDLVQQARRMYPSMTIRLLPSFGESDELLDTIAEWVAGKVRSKERV